MSIDARISRIENLSNGNVRLHLEDRIPFMCVAGQNSLTIIQPKKPVPLDVGDCIWGSDLIYYKSAPMYKRKGFTELHELENK